MDDWERRYREKLLEFIKAPWGVDVNLVEVYSEYSPGFAGYSTYTGPESAYTKTTIKYVHPLTGRQEYRVLDSEELVDFLNSLS